MVFLFVCSLSASQTLKKRRVSPLVMMWYGPYSLIPFLLSAFPLSLELCIYFCRSANCFFLLFFLSQVEVPPPITGSASVKIVVATQPPAVSGMEREPPSGGVAKEAR